MSDRVRKRPEEHQNERQPDQLHPPRNLNPVRRGRHRADRTSLPRAGGTSRFPQTPSTDSRTRVRPVAWDWNFEQDGNLALARDEQTAELALESPVAVSPALKPKRERVSVRAMPSRRAVVQARRARRRRAAGQRRARRIAALVLVSAAVGVTLLLSAFDWGSAERVSTAPAPAQRLLPTGPPRPQVVAVHNSLQLRVPVAQQRITAVGYHAVDNGALTLDPVGEQANKGLFARLFLDSPAATRRASRGTSSAATGRPTPSSTWAQRPAPTSTHPSTASSSGSATT